MGITASIPRETEAQRDREYESQAQDRVGSTHHASWCRQPTLCHAEGLLALSSQVTWGPTEHTLPLGALARVSVILPQAKQGPWTRRWNPASCPPACPSPHLGPISCALGQERVAFVGV